MGFNSILFVALIASAIGIIAALQCYQCGQYNDGVGSITPCINETHMQLKDCPRAEQIYCIKYISEGSILRDCVAKCTEKEDWGTRTYCCGEDGCNGVVQTRAASVFATICWVLVVMAH